MAIPPPQKHQKTTTSTWSSYTLRSQLLLVFTLCVCISLATVMGLSIAFLFLVSSNISSTASQVLSIQLKDNLASSVVLTAASFFEKELERISDAALNIVGNSISDSLREDYSTSAQPSFFDSAATLDRPSLQSGDALRYANRLISLTHSSWTVPEATSSTPPTNLTTDQQRTLTATAAVDSFLRPIYAKNPAIVSLYAGFSNGFFRAYPGTGEREVGGTITAYDPRTRPWYTDAIKYTGVKTSATAGARVVTGPYLDNVGKGWQLTTSRAVAPADGSRSADIGVAAVASTLTVMVERLKEFTLANSSIVAIYRKRDGMALYHPDWNLAAAVGYRSTSNDPAPPAFMYSNATKPRISQELWNKIVRTSDASISTLASAYQSEDNYKDPDTGAPYLVIWKTLSVNDGTTTDPTWISVGSIPLSVVNAPVDAVKSDMTSTVNRTLLIAVPVFIAVLLLVTFMVFFVANAAVKPLIRLSEETTRISNNIGTKDLFRGVQIPGGDSAEASSELRRRRGLAVDETENLEERFYSLVRRIREGTAAAQAAEARGTANVFFGNGGVPTFEASAMDRGVVERLPDLPPPRYSEPTSVAGSPRREKEPDFVNRR
ncbi:hypothetical protein HDU96_007766 [Phlyctochytrium bullatum]|nr:hypothetical protein HDU96_007766 [Phlyctochytrium bullatum]